MWTCPKCKEQIEDQFDSCWKCSGEAQSVKTPPAGKKPLELLELAFIMVAAMPGILLFIGGRVQNGAQAVFRIALFVIGVVGFIVVKVYQRKRMRSAK